MKKLFASLLALTLLVGCSNASSGGTTPATTEAPAEPAGGETTSTGGETIEIWLANVGGPTEWLVGKMNDWAKENNVHVAEFPAEWDKYGKSAGYIRNKQMAKYATKSVVFWDFKSKGTGHMIDLSREYNLNPTIFPY